MRITFPRLGDSHRFGRLFFQEIGMELVVPQPNSQKGIERGSIKSPEDICLPFKIMVDNLMSAWEQGADTVVMPATMGPCRLGEYGELLKVILDQQGYRFNWILLDSINAIGIKELGRRLSLVVSDTNCRKGEILKALYGVYCIIQKFEKLEQEARIRCAYEKQAGASRETVRACRKGLEKAGSIGEARSMIHKYRKQLEELEVVERRNPLRLLITGEIYTTIDSFGNHNIEEQLMDMGVAFEKRISVGWWLNRTIVNPFGGLISEKRRNQYMPHCIGGYAKETVREAIRYQKGGYDGIIQLLPVGCMPEIVAKSVFDGLGRDEGLPVLTIIFDEMCGEAGYITRIEAFVDLLIRRRGTSYGDSLFRN